MRLLLRGRIALFNRAATRPALLVQWKELNIGGLVPDARGNLAKECPLVGPAEPAAEGAVLDALQTIVQAGIRYLLPGAVIRDVIDEKALHVSIL